MKLAHAAYKHPAVPPFSSDLRISDRYPGFVLISSLSTSSATVRNAEGERVPVAEGLRAATGMLAVGLIAGILGAIVGTLGGAKLRAAMAKAFGKDTPAALIEDVIAIGLAFFVVTHVQM